MTPESVTIRVLVPDTSIPWELPVRVADQHDEPGYRSRIADLFTRHVGSIADTVHELAELGLTADATGTARTHSLTPLFKLYLLNEEDMFFGFYPIYPRELTFDDTPIEVYDFAGKDAVLFHHSATDDADATGSQYVAQARAWFDSIWNNIAREQPL